MDHKKLIDRAEKAHNGKATEAECAALHREIIAAQQAALTDAKTYGYDQKGEPLPRRAEAIATGDPAALVALDQRVAELEAIAELMSFHYQRVLKAEEAARIREAGPKATAAVKALPKAIEALSRANAAQADARNEVERLRSELLVARNIASQGGTTVAGLDSETHERMALELGWIIPERESSAHLPDNIQHKRKSSERALVEGWTPPPPRTTGPLKRLQERLDRDGYLRF